MRAIMIVNPHAGRKELLWELPAVWSVFEEAGAELTVELTGSAKRAELITRRAIRAKPDCLICCGGDGTLNGTIACMLKAGSEIPLGYIPAGTTNDFASSLELPKDPAEAAERILQAEPRGIDVGRFGDRIFVYVASFGAFTQSSYATDQNLKNTLGHLAYVLEGLKELPTLKTYHVRVETAEGETFEDDYLFGALSNSTSFGGIVKLDPKSVDLRDGKLELLLVKMPQNLAEFNRVLFALMGGKLDEELITLVHTARADFFCQEPLAWSLDGEYAEGGQHVTAEVLPSAVQLLC